MIQWEYIYSNSAYLKFDQIDDKNNYIMTLRNAFLSGFANGIQPVFGGFSACKKSEKVEKGYHVLYCIILHL